MKKIFEKIEGREPLTKKVYRVLVLYKTPESQEGYNKKWFDRVELLPEGVFKFTAFNSEFPLAMYLSINQVIYVLENVPVNVVDVESESII